MNLFNRIVMVLLLVFGVVLSVTLIFTSLLFPRETIAIVRDTANAVDESMTVGLQILLASVAALSAIVGFLLLLLEVVPRSARGVQLTGVTGASAELTLDSIVDRIRYEAEGVPSVRYAKPVVTSRGREVDVSLVVRTDPAVDDAAKTAEVSQIVRDAVENKMGIRLRRLRIFVQHEPYPKDAKGGEASRQPAVSEPTSSELR